MKILAISGSLRAASSNTVLLRAAALLAPDGVSIKLLERMEEIPPFNPDNDVEPAPAAVIRLRASLQVANLVLFSTPEYAHGVPGTLKNLLDWVVGSGELSGKPVAMLNASSRGEFAQASLREILKTMNAVLLTSAEATVPMRAANAEAAIDDPQYAVPLRQFLSELVKVQSHLPAHHDLTH